MVLCLIVNAQNAELDQLKIGKIAFQLTPPARVKISSVLRNSYFCLPKVLGYVPTQKIWGQFRVKDARPCQNGDPALTLFDTKLKLDLRHKKLLKVSNMSCIPEYQKKLIGAQAFIDNHRRTMSARPSKSGTQVTDLIEGKGKGLVIMLHGKISV